MPLFILAHMLILDVLSSNESTQHSVKIFIMLCCDIRHSMDEYYINIMLCFFISSPEPKAHGELIVYQSSRRPSVRASVRPCVHTFKH